MQKLGLRDIRWLRCPRIDASYHHHLHKEQGSITRQENGNPNHKEIPPCTLQFGGQMITSAGAAAEHRLMPCWWERGMGHPLRKTVGWFLKRLKIELPNDPPISFLVTCPAKPQTSKNLYTNVQSGIIHNSLKLETTQTSTKKWSTHTVD